MSTLDAKILGYLLVPCCVLLAEAIDCEALFEHTGSDRLPHTPAEAFAHVDAMRAFVRARVGERA